MSHDKSKHEVLSDILNAYKNHPSINQLENKVNMRNFFGKNVSFCKPVTPPEIEKLIQCLDTNKAARIDIISPKLQKLQLIF